jgi:hypothetical protein
MKDLPGSLTSLTVPACHVPSSALSNIQPLTSLRSLTISGGPRLASFTARLGPNCDAASLLAALSVQRSLTQLRLAAGCSGCGRLTSEGLLHLTKLAGSLQHLELGLHVEPSADLVGRVSKLTRLTALRLGRVPGAEWGPCP